MAGCFAPGPDGAESGPTGSPRRKTTAARLRNTDRPSLDLAKQDLCRGFGRCAQLVKHHQGALARCVGARPVVAAEGGGDRQAVGALGVWVQGEGSLGIGPGLIGVAPYESKLAQLQKALELHDPDVLDLVLEPGHGVEIAQRLPAPSRGGGVE